MKKLFNKNTLLRIKRLLLTKEAILIIAALLVVVMVALRGDKQASVQQGGNIQGMSESAGSIPGFSSSTEPESTPDLPPEAESTNEPDGSVDEIVEPESEAIPPTPDNSPPGTSGTPPPSALPTASPAATSTPNPSATPSPKPSAPPSEAPPSFAPPQAPSINFKYIHSGGEYKPCADISWAAEGADSILWQLCAANGTVLLEGEIPAKNGAASRITNYAFNTSEQSQNGLYPKGYTLKLIPRYVTVEGGAVNALAPAVMELPYFEVKAQRIDGQLNPVISTNIGLYFVHSYENLTDTETGGKLRITGSLLPIEGAQVSFSIDVLSK